jgi:hypothetical protein
MDGKEGELKEIQLVKKLKLLLFGNKEVSLLEKLMVLINFSICFVFFVWHLLSYIVISKRTLIIEHKNINIEQLILNRGAELGYDSDYFLNNITLFHFASIIIWFLLLLNNVIMLRKLKHFMPIELILILGYYAIMLSLLGITYYYEDTTKFDKIIIILFAVNSLFYNFSIKNGKELFS